MESKFYKQVYVVQAEGGGGLLKKGNRTAMETPAAPSFLKAFGGGARLALVNMAEEEAEQWGIHRGAAMAVAFEPVSEHLEWKDLFPEWIDEEEENEGPSCPEIPLPALPAGEVDAVLALLPCGGRGGRDVGRLQVHLAAASVAARRGRRDGRGRVRVALRACAAAPPPMMEVFRCDEVVAREGDWWVYAAEAARLEEKLALPVGSCNLAMPLWAKGLQHYSNLLIIDHLLQKLFFHAIRYFAGVEVPQIQQQIIQTIAISFTTKF